MRGKAKTWSLGLINAQSIMHIVFHFYDVLRFDSTVVINILINISSLKLNNQILRSLVHEYASELTTVPKAKIFCNCKRRNL